MINYSVKLNQLKHSITDQFGDHEWEWLTQDAPDRAMTRISLECKRCRVTMMTEISRQTIENYNFNVVDYVKEEILNTIMKQVPESCEESIRLNICRNIHES